LVSGSLFDIMDFQNQLICSKLFGFRMTDLSKRLPPLGTLVVFDSAMRLGSFSRAADECALSQASVSRQIRQLEENLGTKLFVRQRHDVLPTSAGEQLAVSVRQSLLELAATATDLRSAAAGQNVFKIFSDISIASNILTPLLGLFQRKHPNIQFHILSTYEPIERTLTSFDIGFQVGKRTDDLFEVETIGDDLIFPVCSPDFIHRHGPIETAAELAKLPLLHFDYEDKDWPNWRSFLATFRIREPVPVETLSFSSYQVILDVAQRGEGVALGWERSVRNRIDDGKLVRLTDMAIHQPDGVCVYLRKNYRAHAITRSIIEDVRSSIVQIGADD